MPTTDREPLCTITALPLSSCALGTDQPEFPGLHSSYWLMRQTILLLPTSVSLFRQVLAGCCEPLLEDGPSRRYLCYPCTGAWVHTPPRFSGALVRFFPDHIGLILGLRNSAREKSPASSFLQVRVFRGCNHSLIFRLLYLLDPPAALTAGFPLAIGPYTPRRTRTVTGYKLRHRYVSESGQLTRQDLGQLLPPRTCWIAALSAAPSPLHVVELLSRLKVGLSTKSLDYV